MTDAHNHLQDIRFDGIRDQIIAEMITSGVTRCVVNATSPADWHQVAGLAKDHPELIIPSFGLHPWEKPPEGWLDQLIHYLDTVPNACIGECGLDRWMRDYDIELQTEIFIAQLILAEKRNLPLSIHCLRAWGHLIDILESHPLPKRGFLLHSYGGSAELVPRLVKLGAYFSFSGYFLHDRKQNVRDAFKLVPPDRLLLETDAPDMLPPESAISHALSNGINHPVNINAIHESSSSFLDTSKIKYNFDRLLRIDVYICTNDVIWCMRTTITLDDTLFERAATITGDHNASSLLTKALEMMIASESKKRLLRLSGKAPEFIIPGRASRATDLGLVAEDDSSYNSDNS